MSELVRAQARAIREKQLQKNQVPPVSQEPLRCKTFWEKEDDQKLIQFVQSFDDQVNWEEVQKIFPLRTPSQCKARWRLHLQMEGREKKLSSKEECRLLTLFKRFGSDWSLIANYYGSHSPSFLRYSFYKIMKREIFPNSTRFKKRTLLYVDEALQKIKEKSAHAESDFSMPSSENPQQAHPHDYHSKIDTCKSNKSSSSHSLVSPPSPKKNDSPTLIASASSQSTGVQAKQQLPRPILSNLNVAAPLTSFAYNQNIFPHSQITQFSQGRSQLNLQPNYYNVNPFYMVNFGESFQTRTNMGMINSERLLPAYQTQLPYQTKQMMTPVPQRRYPVYFQPIVLVNKADSAQLNCLSGHQ